MRKENIHGGPSLSPKKKFSIQQRRRKILSLIQDNPGIRQIDIAKKLNTTRHTISLDLRKMSEEIKYQNTESWMLQRDRILSELQSKKAVCEDRMQRLSKNPHQGSRWMEEWQKLLDKESKILGVYSPDRLLIKQSTEFDKDQEDASIDAMLKTMNLDQKIIDVLPTKKKESAQITDETSDDD